MTSSPLPRVEYSKTENLSNAICLGQRPVYGWVVFLRGDEINSNPLSWWDTTSIVGRGNKHFVHLKIFLCCTCLLHFLWGYHSIYEVINLISCNIVYVPRKCLYFYHFAKSSQRIIEYFLEYSSCTTRVTSDYNKKWYWSTLSGYLVYTN